MRAEAKITDACTSTEHLRAPVVADSQSAAVPHFCKQKWKKLLAIQVEERTFTKLVSDISTQNETTCNYKNNLLGNFS